MRTILLLAYAVSPTKGSEYAVAWNYISEMSKSNKIIVLYGKSDREMGDVREISEYLKNNKVSNVTFIQIKGSSKWGQEGIIYSNFVKTIIYDYLSYKQWHINAYQAALKLIEKEKIDVAHFLCPIGFKEPGYLWKLPLPYIWGPVTGAHPRPLALFSVLTLSQKIIAFMRNQIHPLMLRFLPRVSSAFRRADIVFAATPKTQQQIRYFYSRKVDYLPENGIRTIERTIPIIREKGSTLKLIWIGRLEPYKGLKILLDALKELKIENNWELHVVGGGELFEEYYAYAQNYQINSHIIWYKTLPRQKVQDLLYQSHLHLITSLGEGNPTVLIEAMAKGIPTISLDHCGMSGVIDETCGVKIPISSYSQIIADLVHHITYLNNNPEQITKLSLGTIKRADSYLWSERVRFFNQKIEEAIQNFQS